MYIIIKEFSDMVVRVADFDIPSGINASIFTEAGEIIVASGSGTASVMDAPVTDGLVMVSDLTEAKKWKLVSQSTLGAGNALLTNKSGSLVAVGTVVINDADSDESFKTTTTEGDRRVVGVTGEEIANNAEGKVIGGFQLTTVLVQGNVSRGMWLIASSTVGRAKAAGYTRPVGCIGMAMTEYSGGGAGSVQALISVDIYLGASKGKGYVCGGYTTTYVNNGRILSYVTETTAAQASANLSQARYHLAGVSGSLAGYFAGGFTGSAVATADKVTYATDTTAAQASANLSQARYSVGGVSGSLAGYFAGGFTTVAVATADKVTYATDTTAAQASANLSQARYYLAGVSGSLAGYFAGGSTGSVVATADKVTYATDTTAAQASANLSQARHSVGGVSGSLAGYFAGGSTGSAVATADKVTYATDTTAAQASANLSQARQSVAGVSGSLAGYFAGGSTGSAVATADKVTYATDTTAAQASANLPDSSYGHGAVSTVNY